MRLGEAVIGQRILADRFVALKRQIPLLYAVILVNLTGFHLASGRPSWATAFAAPITGIIIYRLVHWHRLPDQLPSPAIHREMARNLLFTRVLCVLFLSWSLWILSDGTELKQQYVILFASLAAIGCAIALSSAPDAARQPLMLVAMPIAIWSVLSGEMSYIVVGVSIAVVVALICQILNVQENALSSLIRSQVTVEHEREKVRASEERYEFVSRATKDLIWDWDLKTDVLVWNDAVHTQLGYSPDEVRPSITWWIEHIHPDHRNRVIEHSRRVVESGAEKFEDEYPFRRADGSYGHFHDRGYILRDAEGTAVRMVGAMQDLTRRKRAEEALVRAANRDSLTGLANRKSFVEDLGLAATQAVDAGRAFSLLLLDLDEFKNVNDTLGHDGGDALLMEVAARLRGCLPPGSDVARLGGDEFAVLLRDVSTKREVEACAAAVLQSLREPFVHDGRVVDCAATIGAAMIPDHGVTPEEILKSADVALYAAKATRRGGYLMFGPNHRAKLRKRITMLRLARSAIREDRVEPFYQPKVRLADQSVVGFEALLRWRRPGQGLQLPGTIKAAFDDLELAAAISDRMLDQVLSDVRTWLDRGCPFGHVAINAAAPEFRRDGFAERLLGRLHKAAVAPEHIQLEVTETVFVGRGAESVDRALKTLSAAGVSIALDDFGTGYASLRHLKQFPVDLIKIDRSFVRDMESDPGDEAIVRAVINLGRSLGVKVVAEGVETAGQVKRLLDLKCDYAQGFVFSRAVPGNRVPALLKRMERGDARISNRAATNLRLVASRS